MSADKYRGKFLKDDNDPGTAFTQVVPLNPKLLHLIKLVIHSADNPTLTVKGFVNNLLTEHFKDYEADIRELYLENNSNFDNL